MSISMSDTQEIIEKLHEINTNVEVVKTKVEYIESTVERNERAAEGIDNKVDKNSKDIFYLKGAWAAISGLMIWIAQHVMRGGASG
jgi:hypothetical protein